jgi:uncharacterized protein (DUF885 family)
MFKIVMNCYLRLLLLIFLSTLGMSRILAADLEDRRAQLKAAIETEWQYELRVHPDMATHAGDSRYNDRLGDYSPKFFADNAQHARKMLDQLQPIDTSGFPEQELLNKLLMVRGLQDEVDGAKFKDWEMPVSQLEGIHMQLATLVSDTPFRSNKDYQDYLARLHQIPRVLDQVTSDMRIGMRDHLIQPRYLLEKVVSQTQYIADASADSSPFTQPLKKIPAGVSGADRERASEAILAAVKNEVAPAYAEFARFMRDEYARKGRTGLGIWALPDGGERYRYAIRIMTTASMEPDEIHALGLRNVAEIEREMLNVARHEGFSDLKTFNEHIRIDRKNYAVSGQQLLELYQHYADQMYTKLPQLFGNLPKNKLVVVPMESFREADAVPADYTIGAGDNSLPGRINVNEFSPQTRLLLNVEAIAYHEGVPGHHLQFSIENELTELPAFRKFGVSYNAYSEGWAFYSEQLGKEVGFYQDPYSDYGRLENEMWRAVRLVVDTGVHYKHWSRDQMVDYFRQHTAMDEPNIQSEVDRYIAWPAQALCYKIGQMKILELREKAKRELGDNFDIREFHDTVLDEGALPLDALEAKIDGWIRSVRARGLPKLPGLPNAALR